MILILILNVESINLFPKKKGVLPLRLKRSNATLLTQKEKPKAKSKEDQALIS